MSGTTEITLICADPGAFLSYIERENITVSSVQQIDELTLRLQLKQRDLTRLKRLAERRGAQITVVRPDRFTGAVRAALHRPVLLIGLVLLLIAGLYLPKRVFFLRVEGNRTVPTRLILDKAEQCGIGFGASAGDVRSERVKNALLEAIPQLQWAGVNTSGCVATISVKERQLPLLPEDHNMATSIVASRDGVICDMTVTSGAPVCQIGQAVSKGDKLITGYVDCDRSVRATRSAGEIYAATIHKIDALMPMDYKLRGVQMEKTQKISVIFGKNRINFFSGSGILDSSCVKMYEEKYLTLPGGFHLPIKIVTEAWITYREPADVVSSRDDTQLLSKLSRRYIEQQMIAGSVLSQRENTEVLDGMIRLTGEYGCIEMIGREQNEEIIKP
ncbi:MAG: hypothetical protein E7470_06720 [Ruminococcaceae bacterium]|nr:hypothetical protein [Oscillospiraceae bacterium]